MQNGIILYRQVLIIERREGFEKSKQLPEWEEYGNTKQLTRIRIPIMKPPSQATAVPEPVQFLLSHEYCGNTCPLPQSFSFICPPSSRHHTYYKYLTTLAFWCPIWNGSFPSDQGISSTAQMWKDHVALFITQPHWFDQVSRTTQHLWQSHIDPQNLIFTHSISMSIRLGSWTFWRHLIARDQVAYSSRKVIKSF